MRGITLKELKYSLERDLVRSMKIKFDPAENGWVLMVMESTHGEYLPLMHNRDHVCRKWVQVQRLVHYIATLPPSTYSITIELLDYRLSLANEKHPQKKES
jgi:hypothetical protein